MTMTISWLFIFAISYKVTPALGFSSVSQRSCIFDTTRCKAIGSKLFGPEDDFDDEIGRLEPYGTVGSGMELAQDFFKEVRQRGQEATEEISTMEESTISISKGTSKSLEKASASETNVDATIGSGPFPKKKFTGSQELFYAQKPPSASYGGQARTPREMMMEREYQLVGRAERGIVIQAVVAVIALAFYIYIGLSGGIVSDSDGQNQFFGADDEIPFEQLMPVQRDREVSVWL